MYLHYSDFDAVTFDVYGTLIDWEPSIIDFLTRWAAKAGIDAGEIDLLMAFDRARAEIQKVRPAYLYPDVLRLCFDRISEDFGVAPDLDARERFAAAPHGWPPFDDSHDGLTALQSRMKVGALSNIDDASLRASCRRLDFTFDVVVTAERVGAYKPDMPHFETALADLAAMNIPPERVLHVGQSLRADIVPANRLGLTSVWINRPEKLLGLSGERAAEARPDLTVSSVAALVAELKADDAIIA